MTPISSAQSLIEFVSDASSWSDFDYGFRSLNIRLGQVKRDDDETLRKIAEVFKRASLKLQETPHFWDVTPRTPDGYLLIPAPIPTELRDICSYLMIAQWDDNLINKYKKINFCLQVKLLHSQVADRCSIELLCRLLLFSRRFTISEGIDACNLAMTSPGPHSFMTLLEKMGPRTDFHDPILEFLLGRCGGHSPQIFGSEFNDVLEKIARAIPPIDDDLDRALLIIGLIHHEIPDTRCVDPQTHVSRRSLTQALDSSIGEEFRASLEPESVLCCSHILDGIGDFIHLLNFEKSVTPFFKNSLKFMGIIEGKERNDIGLCGSIWARSNSPVKLCYSLDWTSQRGRAKSTLDKLVPVSAQNDWEGAKFIFSVSHLRRDFRDLAKSKPHAHLNEISYPSANEDVLTTRMGLKPGNVGVWLFEEPKNPLLAIASASEKLKKLLGCCKHIGQEDSRLATWYHESLICANMLYKENENDKVIYAALLMASRVEKPIKRVIFKTKSLPEFVKDGLLRRYEDLRQLNVNKVVLNDSTLFESSSPGLELILITEHLQEADWAAYKELINGISGAGGDNTLSEALSNPNTWPPLFFTQHLFKEDSYYGLLHLAYRLPDELSGKKGLISYLEVANAVAQRVSPLSLAQALVRILERTGDEPLREAWTALTRLARSEMNLNHFIVPLLTEQLILGSYPEIIEQRRRLLANDTLPDAEKCREYIAIVRSRVAPFI